jgi:hypothetical protein
MCAELTRVATAIYTWNGGGFVTAHDVVFSLSDGVLIPLKMETPNGEDTSSG